ncbi:MAG: MBOAT family protein [Chloroflexi bacterium]|nr:MBOAT family protein [Chloroflexota bacterium]
MNLNSPIFLFLFLPVFMLVYHLTRKRLRQIAGILGSLLFYAWGNLSYIPLMVGLTLFTYALAFGLARWRERKLSLVLLWTGILVNVALLVGFKLWADLAYPLGLSYVTFQVIAYLLEVYYGRIPPEGDLLAFSFHLLLFPKLPVGPIIRYSQVKAQIHDLQARPADVADGLRRFIRGFGKKVLIADTLSKVVTPIFALATPSVAPSIAWLVILSYSLQLFFDFSGYTDMALGLGRMMGLRFIENFDFPYISKSIGEFWRRWHISLSSWFRDFVFYPLERRRLKWIGQPFNILVVFALTGLWHGLSWNFFAWGLLHGLALVFEATGLGRRLRTGWAPLQHAYALAVILVGWVFFRSPTPAFALEFLSRLLGNASGLRPLPFELTSPLPFIEPSFVLALAAGILLSLPVGHWLESQFRKRLPEGLLPTLAARFAGDLILIALLVLSLAAMVSSTFAPGIYERF